MADGGGAGGATVDVSGLRHRFRTADGQLQVLDGLDLTIEGGGFVAVTGPSGAGKSTLLAVLGGLEAHQDGRVVVDGLDLGSLSGDALAAYRRNTVGFVFQHFGLLDALTAAENVELAGTLAGARPTARRSRAADLLGAVGLADRSTHRPTQLSGGERQRVASARALVNRPRLLLADEPTGNLDEDSAASVTELLEQVHVETGCTLVVVTHNRALAARAAHQYALSAGRLELVVNL